MLGCWCWLGAEELSGEEGTGMWQPSWMREARGAAGGRAAGASSTASRLLFWHFLTCTLQFYLTLCSFTLIKQPSASKVKIKNISTPFRRCGCLEWMESDVPVV